MRLTFLNLNTNELYRIFSFLKPADVFNMAQPDRKLNALLNTQHIFYSPIYENVSGDLTQNPTIWNVLSSANTIKDLYQTKEHLFKTVPNATGCFKIEMSWLEILKTQLEGGKPQVTVETFEKEKYEWCLPITSEYIKSYISRDMKKEYLNLVNDTQTYNVMPQLL